MWKYIERKLNTAKTHREAIEKRQAALTKAPFCKHCGGDGEVRVRGVRSPSGYEMCYHCGGSGRDLDQSKESTP